MVGFFTFHAYKSWMPDRDEGYVRRGEGVLPPDPEMAHQYDRNSKEEGVFFDEHTQRLIIQSVLDAAPFQSFRTHSISTDNTHIHILVSWTSGRELAKVSQSIKTSITRALNTALHKRTWLSDGGDQKQVVDAEHFDYLITDYVPKHTGLKWREGVGFYG